MKSSQENTTWTWLAVARMCCLLHLSLSRKLGVRAAGAGWQTRIDEALQDWLKTHKPA
jgi:hypothetical protein